MNIKEVINDTFKKSHSEISRRQALLRLGLAAVVAYSAPMMLKLSEAQASSGGSGSFGSTGGTGSFGSTGGSGGFPSDGTTGVRGGPGEVPISSMSDGTTRASGGRG